TFSASVRDGAGLSSPSYDYILSSQTPSVSIWFTNWGANRQLTIWGQVSDEIAGGRTVTFSGAVSGSVVTDADGSFQVTLQATQLGEIRASVTDSWGQTFNQVVQTLTNNAPQILSFSAHCGPGNCWTFCGTVSDEYS